MQAGLKGWQQTLQTLWAAMNITIQLLMPGCVTMVLNGGGLPSTPLRRVRLRHLPAPVLRLRAQPARLALHRQHQPAPRVLQAQHQQRYLPVHRHLVQPVHQQQQQSNGYTYN